MNKPTPERLSSTRDHSGVLDSVSHATAMLNEFPFGTAEFDDACRRLRQASDEGVAQADLMLGHVFVRNGSMDQAPAKARHYFERAHAAGIPEATERLADLQLSGRMGPADVAALELYEERAKSGDAPALCNLAFLKALDELPDTDHSRATQLYLLAAMQGHTLAFHALGIRLSNGWGCRADPEEGLAWLMLSQLRQFPLAPRLVGQVRLQLARSSLTRVNARVEALKHAIRELGAQIAELHAGLGQTQAFSTRFREAIAEAADRTVVLTPNETGPGSAEPELTERCASPKVSSAEGFADELAMAHLIDAALPELRAPADVAALRGGTEVDAFNGNAAMFSPSFSTPVMHIMQRRFARLLGADVRCFEPMSVLHYGPGHGYATHVDYFDPDRIKAHERIGDFGGQRNVTCLIYLTSPIEGGDTLYPSASCRISGQPGRAVVHYNVDAQGNPDPNSVHEGTPIVAGDKWLARTAIRASRLY